MKTALLFILMMLVLIAPHEFGHFIVGKLCNVKINEFSIGMGPLLFKRKKGETQYSIRLIPIGGYCAMEGEENSSDNPRAFNNKSPLQRIAILLAGVTMNVIIAMLACTIAFQISGIPINTVDEVVSNSPAAVAGIKSGDKIVSVDGNETSSWDDVTTAISNYDKKTELQIEVDRNGATENYSVKPKYDKEKKAYVIGVVAAVSKNPIRAIPYGISTTGQLVKEMFNAFSTMFKNGINRNDISGPVGLVKIVGQTSSAGASSYLMLLALVSLNLALINLIPIPGLDGGKLLFVILKWFTKGKINDNMEYKASIVGLVILLCLFVLVTINDIGNII